MKLPAFYSELEALAEALGLSVVLDRGAFTGGLCLFEGQELLVLNLSASLAQRTRQLAEILAARDLGNVYIKPGVRSALERYQVTAPG